MNANNGSAETINWPRLPGMKSIRERLKIDICSIPGHRQNLYRIDRCEQGVAYGTMRAIAQALHCTAEDLLTTPTPERLAEIEVSYREKQLAEAKARATAAAAGSAAQVERAS